MQTKQYIGLFFMLLMLGSNLQPLQKFVVDSDIEITNPIDQESKDSPEKELKSDLFLVVYSAQTCRLTRIFSTFSRSVSINLNKGYDLIVLPPPEC